MSSSSSTNENSDVDHTTTSSASLLRLDIIMETAAAYSAAKSRVPVASREFSSIPSKPSSSAVYARSIGRLVPPTGPAPSGLLFTRP